MIQLAIYLNDTFSYLMRFVVASSLCGSFDGEFPWKDLWDEDRKIFWLKSCLIIVVEGLLALSLTLLLAACGNRPGIYRPSCRSSSEVIILAVSESRSFERAIRRVWKEERRHVR